MITTVKVRGFVNEFMIKITVISLRTLPSTLNVLYINYMGKWKGIKLTGVLFSPPFLLMIRN